LFISAVALGSSEARISLTPSTLPLMFRLSLKARPARCDETRRVAASLEARLAELLGLGEGDHVTVNEIACADMGCPDVETVVLVMRRGERTRALKIPKAARLVEEADLQTAIAAAGDPGLA
jgi:hypothetical protein